MSERPDWWPKWEPSEHPAFGFYSEVWDAACAAMERAMLVRYIQPPRHCRRSAAEPRQMGLFEAAP